MTAAFIILLLPLVAAASNLLLLRKKANLSAYVSTLSAAICLVLTFGLIRQSDLSDLGSFNWIKIADFKLDIGIELQGLGLGMILVVTLIGFLVHLFSLGYMREDAGKARYFSGLSLFMFSMTGIVFADNLAMMFIFWELVGVSSYLLIGHWYHKNTAAEAAKKAFLVNRIGDFGFMIGILLIWGSFGSVNFVEIEESLRNGNYDKGLRNWSVFCIFCGAIGKSAQVPLHVWLPDAMEGPTPVSALIHAATMVAAGVFMLTKVLFLIEVAPTAASVIQYVGAITALIAALMATQQNDIKKILAYSTLSQLGYMIMAVGFAGLWSGGESLGESASNAGFFHLYTHAFFKALLFLGSGAIIYACHHEQNIWKMGGLIGRMKITSITFLIATAALAGIYPLSGFYSKDAIMTVAEHKPILLVIGSFVAFLTAFYMTRLCVVVFFGKARSWSSEEAKEVPLLMLVPLLVLTIGAIFAGQPFAYSWFVDPEKIPHPEGALPFILTAIGVAGIVSGFFLYRGRDQEPYPVQVLSRKFYLDEIYIILVRIFQDAVAWVAKQIDRLLIDGLLVRGVARLVTEIGSVLRGMQSGNLQGYAFLFGVGVILVLYIINAAIG
ncbi:MAG: NADH-quinone oxidoreductase subunit L [Akkermansiaceae bacterium]|jgi:NADH-quinone oxidoreductase subunit L|nr:NADH-quinone oxidoreductase subunit L [Akkermansiaceae bacterium]